MRSEINGITFEIEEYEEGVWYWEGGGTESTRMFSSSWEAQQDTIDSVRRWQKERREELEEELERLRYGSYEEQVRREYEQRIRR